MSENEDASLNVVDIQNCYNVIEYCANQGAFKGFDVMKQVIALQGRLAAFLEAAKREQQTEENKGTQ